MAHSGTKEKVDDELRERKELGYTPYRMPYIVEGSDHLAEQDLKFILSPRVGRKG